MKLSSLCNFLQSPVSSSLLDPKIHLRTLFSNILILCFFLNVGDQVSCPYKTTGRIMVLYILTFTFLDSRQKDKRLAYQYHFIKHRNENQNSYVSKGMLSLNKDKFFTLTFIGRAVQRLYQRMYFSLAERYNVCTAASYLC
jgi:hypothetical protein